MASRAFRRVTFTIVLAAAFATVPVGAQSAFSDQTAGTGTTFTTFVWGDVLFGAHYPGGAVGDFNRDGWPDLFFLGGGGTEDALFINNQDGTFTDEAVAWGVFVEHRGKGITVGDFNNDGWQDVYITSGGDMSGSDRIGQHILYKNNGNGTFTNIATSAGVNWTSDTYRTTITPSFGDYDLDGDLDLFVATWHSMNGNDGNRLFRNNGDETFTDVTVASGISGGYRGFAARFADMNGDRYPELLIAADFDTSQYFINDGDGTFTNGTVGSGTALDSNGMGTTVADFNHDGLLDWYVTSIYRDNPFTNNGNFLYVNQGSDTYVDLPEEDGAKDGGWGWGTEAVDYDNDGDIDIAATNAGGDQAAPEWQFETTKLFRNNGDMTFTEEGLAIGLDHTGDGRGLFTLDYNRDGKMDIVITSNSEPTYLFRNDLSGSNINYIQLVFDTSMNPNLAPDGFGTRVTAVSAGGTQYHYLAGGATYVSQSELMLHIGLGADTSVDLTVDWADGSQSVLNAQAANQRLTVVAPAAGPGAPGESSEGSGNQLQASYNSGTGMVDATYTPACDATDHTVYYGDIDSLPAYGGAVCGIGTTGSVSFDPGSGATFYVVVGNDGAVEGPYGERRIAGAPEDRPEDVGTAGCDFPKDLSGTCTLP